MVDRFSAEHHHPNTWNIHTYRSRVGDGTGAQSLNPRWGTEQDRFVFRLSLPIHHAHGPGVDGAQHGVFSSIYRGPPTVLQCSVFSKSKLRTHPFMGSARIDLTDLTPTHPLHIDVPLAGVGSGHLCLDVSLRYQLMTSLGRATKMPQVRPVLMAFDGIVELLIPYVDGKSCNCFTSIGTQRPFTSFDR